MGLRYLDRSVALDAIDPAAPRPAQVDAAMLSLPLESFAVSDLVRLECSIHALRTNDTARLSDLKGFFASVKVLPIEPIVFDRAAMLRAVHLTLKTPDALHLETAIHHGCNEFWTNDRELARRNVGLTFRSF